VGNARRRYGIVLAGGFDHFDAGACRPSGRLIAKARERIPG